MPKLPRVIGLLFGCIGLMALAGGYDALITDTHLVDLQAELEDGFTLPAPFSGALLLGVAGYAVLLASGRGNAVAPRWVWGVFSLLFLEAAVDETVAIHERLGNAAGIDWLVLYTPLFAIAGVLWLKVLRALEGRPERLLWLAGAASWVMAQMLEVYAYGGSDEGRPGAGVTGAVEELLEMTGSLFLLWTVLSLYRRLNQAQASAPARVKVVPGAPRRDHETV